MAASVLKGDGGISWRLGLTLGIVLFVAAFGTAGYVIIEGWSILDALYMTAITVSTVGFGEVQNLSPFGRLFTIMLILAGLAVISLWGSQVASMVLHRELQDLFRRRRMEKVIRKLEGHIIICGGGEAGRRVIEEFTKARQKFVVIERDAEAIQQIQEMFPDVLVIQGDATRDEVLEQANIKRARGLIAALPEDTENLFVVISAKGLNPNLEVVARATEPHTQEKLFRVGADHVISPRVIEGLRMASVMLRPTVVSFLDVMMRGEDVTLRLEEVPVPEGAKLAGRTLAEVQIPQKTGLMVIAMRRADGRFTFNPRSESRMHVGDVLIVLGEPEQVDRLRTYVQTGAVPGEGVGEDKRESL